MGYLIDSSDASLLKKLIEFMLRTGYEVLTPEIIEKLLTEFHEKYRDQSSAH